MIRSEVKTHFEAEPASDWGAEYDHAEDPSVLKWKSSGSAGKPIKLPSQGFEGVGVAHGNQESVTKDWTYEYGPKTPGISSRPALRSLGARSTTTVFMASIMPAFMFMVQMI